MTVKCVIIVHRWYTYYTWEGDERDAYGLIDRISGSQGLTDAIWQPITSNNDGCSP